MLTAAGLVVAELLLDGSSILAPLVPAYTRRPADARDAASLTEDLANGVRLLVCSDHQVQDEARVAVDAEVGPEAPDLSQLLMCIAVVQRTGAGHLFRGDFWGRGGNAT